MIVSCWLTNNISCSAMWRCVYGLSPYQLGMSMSCLRNSYRYVYDLSPYQLQMPMTYLRTNYRYVYDLSPYQLQVCLWPVSVPTTDMSMTCLLKSYRYVPDLSPYQPPHALLQWPITHCQNPPQQYLCTSALFLLHHLNNSCMLF
jgi:hypothetical protein